MKYVITGASGFVASHLTRYLCQQAGNSILLLSRDPAAVVPEGCGRATYVPAEVLRLLKDLQAFKPDCIIHLAAISSPDKCQVEPELAREGNVIFTRQLVDIAHDLGCHFTFMSSDWVFDGKQAPAGGFTEVEEPLAESVYAQTKLDCEQIVKELGNNASIIRASLIFGSECGPTRGTLSWLEDGLRGLFSVKLFEDEWRTPVYIDDVIQVLSRVSEQKLPGVFHCAGPQRLSRAEFGEIYARVTEAPLALIERVKRCDVSSPASRPEDISLNATETEKRVGLRFLSPEEAFIKMRAS